MEKALLAAVRKAKSFLLIAHNNPDVDSAGSAVAFGLALKQQGKKVHWHTTGTVNDQVKRVTQLADFSDKANFAVDMIVVFDTNSPMMFNFEGVKNSKAVKVLVDHHFPKKETNEVFDFLVCDDKAKSTTVLVYRLLKAMKVKLDHEKALVLAAGMVTDTANFIAADDALFRDLSAALREGGVSFQEVLRFITVPMDASEKIARMKAAQRVQYFREGDWLIATSRVSAFEGSIAQMLVQMGADVSFVASDNHGEAKISARARDEVTELGLHLGRDVMPHAAKLLKGDAGGHAAAAGATGTDPNSLDAALGIVVEKTREFLKNRKK
jgi:nanoRNase/pAp phosphatase (c-di-AMP/oligoRNAs hydrolase)